MKLETQRALRASVENLLSQAMTVYSQVLSAGADEDVAHVRIQRLFSATAETPRETAIVGYRPIVPHIWFGFENDSGLAATLVESRPTETPEVIDKRNRLSVILDDPGASSWFSLEIELPWTEVRHCKTVSVTFVGRADHPLEIKSQVRACQTSGTMMEFGPASIALETELRVVTAEIAVALPHSEFVDFDRQPLLLLFFPLSKARVDMNHLLLSFA